MRIATSCVVAIAIAMAMVPDASAQTAEAEMLFREGKRLMLKHKTAEACEKFEASERLEPTVGTELNLADCREKNGQTSSAWAMFVKAAATAKHAGSEKRAAEARRRATTLEKQLVYLTIQVPADHAVDDLVIKRNDTPIDRALWDQAVPVDPDDYTITAEAPDHTAWSETVTVKTKSKVIEVPKLEADHSAVHEDPDHGDGTTPKHTRVDRGDTHPRRRKPPPEAPEPPRKYTSAMIALAAAGVGAVAVGTGFALYANSVENQSDAVCPTTSCADSHGVDLNKVARTDGWIANISWGLGGAAIAGAIVVWYVGSPARDDAVSVVPVVGRDQAGLAVGGRF